jgi:hypothetical protein
MPLKSEASSTFLKNTTLQNKENQLGTSVSNHATLTITQQWRSLAKEAMG